MKTVPACLTCVLGDVYAAAQQVNPLEWLLDNLLDVSRLTHGKITLRKQPITLRAIVTDALAATRSQIEARGQVISLTLPEAPLCFAADPIRLVQVFGNLLDNASKYSPRGGTISVTGYGESGDVVVRVRDTGIGIARDMLPRVFNLFVQNDPFLVRSEDGLGVGLTLARKLVELHRGSIAAESEGLGRGSEFVVRLPVCDPAAAVNLPPLA